MSSYACIGMHTLYAYDDEEILNTLGMDPDWLSKVKTDLIAVFLHTPENSCNTYAFTFCESGKVL